MIKNTAGLAPYHSRVLCGDGAIGTLLLEAGVPRDRCFEELCVTEPDRVEALEVAPVESS